MILHACECFPWTQPKLGCELHQGAKARYSFQGTGGDGDGEEEGDTLRGDTHRAVASSDSAGGTFERPRLCWGIIVGVTRTLKKKIAGATEEQSELVWKVGTRKGMLRSEGGKAPAFRSKNNTTTCDLREGHVRDRVGAPLWAQAWSVVLFLALRGATWSAAGGSGSTLRSSTW